VQEREHSFLGYRREPALVDRAPAEGKLLRNFSRAIDVLSIDDLWIEHDKEI
jgi:hypothetical protein